MTVSDTPNRVQYTGNDATSNFSTGSVIFYDATDLIVTTRIIATGVEEVLTYGAGNDYTVSGGEGLAGSITLTAGALPATKTITIERSLPYSQTDDYVEGESFLAETLETRLDKLTILGQQNRDATQRSIKFSSTLSTSLAGRIKEAPVDGKFLVWDGVTGDIVNGEVGTLTNLDTVFSSLTINDILQYNGTNWVNVTADSITSTEFLDSTFRVQDNGDPTKELAFQLSGLSTSTLVTVTIPNQSGTILYVGNVLDEDNMATNSAVYPPSQQSTKAYVDNAIAGVSDQETTFILNGTGTPAVSNVQGVNTVSSVTDHSTGNYTINFGSNFANANYDVQITCEAVGTAANQGVYACIYPSGKAVGSLRIMVMQVSSSMSFVDAANIHVKIKGALA